jgi:hypothetical protein
VLWHCGVCGGRGVTCDEKAKGNASINLGVKTTRVVTGSKNAVPGKNLSPLRAFSPHETNESESFSRVSQVESRRRLDFSRDSVGLYVAITSSHHG